MFVQVVNCLFLIACVHNASLELIVFGSLHFGFHAIWTSQDIYYKYMPTDIWLPIVSSSSRYRQFFGLSMYGLFFVVAPLYDVSKGAKYLNSAGVVRNFRMVIIAVSTVFSLAFSTDSRRRRVTKPSPSSVNKSSLGYRRDVFLSI